VSYIRAACPETLAHARARFGAFHGCAPSALVTARCVRTIPKLLVQLGSLRGLIYSADRGDGGARTYIHFMENEPLLACDAQGTQLYIIGGRYRVTRRGIEG
jgi:hypothetical protein